VKNMVHKKRKRKAKLPKKVSQYISDQIKSEREAGYPQRQAIAIAFSMARRKFPQYSHLLVR